MKRQLSFFSAASLVVANMIGVGVFTTSGFALANLGRPEPVLLAWLIGGLLALCGALSYGALAHCIPVSGGEYTFLRHTIHPLAGFMAGWVSLLAGFTAPIAAAALALGAYLIPIFPGALRAEWTGTWVILGVALMHGVRLKPGLFFQNLGVVLKLVALLAFIVLGFYCMPEAPTIGPLHVGNIEVGAFAETLVWVSFSYSGWNAAVYLGGEIKNPTLNINRALLFATVSVMGFYLLLNVVFLYAAPAQQLAGQAEIGAIAAKSLGGIGLQRFLSALVMLALFTSISSMMMTGPRVYAQMAKDSLMPRLFSKGTEVPQKAVALQAGIAIPLLWLSSLADLLTYIGFTLGLSAAATVAGLMIFRRRRGAKHVPTPGYPWVPLIFILSTLIISGRLVLRQPLESGIGLLITCLGLPIYAFARRFKFAGHLW